MRTDYDRIRGWINPNDASNSLVPRDNYNKSKPLGDNYDTIYKKDYLASAPAKQQNYKPEDRHLSTAPFIAESTYKDMTRSSNKPGYSPIKPQRSKPNPTSGFEDQTIYQRDYIGKSPARVMRDDIGNTNKLIFGGTSNQKSVGPLQDKTVYRDDYVGHEADPNTVYVVNPFMETTLPKPKHRVDKTIYMGDYVPKKVSNKKCPIYDMPEVPQELRNEGGHIYFDADWE